jgi:hypothetical protein
MRKRFTLLSVRGDSQVGPPGIALVLTILLVGLLFGMGMTMVNLASSDYQVANNESRSVQSLFNADAGTEEAKMRVSPNAPSGAKIPINTAADWRAYILSGHTQSEVQTLDPTYGKKVWDPSQTESTSNYVFYNTVQTGPGAIPWGWARIQQKVNASGNPIYQDVLTGADTTAASQTVGTSTVFNQPVLIITSEGIQGPVRRMISMELQPVVATTTTTTEVIHDPFADAAHGVAGVELIGNANTDSYDSRDGPYNVNGNRRSNGDVSTDSVAAGAISVAPGSIVDGQAIVGPGGDTSTAIVNQGTITQGVGTEPAAMNLPLSTIPANLTNLGALNPGNPPRGTDCSVMLGEGSYWFASIRITGNAKLCTTGAVKIYVTGDVNIGGNGVATAGNLPPNLLIYGTVDPTNNANRCTSVSIHGNGGFYGAVYAPQASVNVSGNGHAYGALTGNTVRINGSNGAQFHYDEALGNLGRTVTTTVTTNYTTTGFTRYSWREIAF